MVDQRGSGNAEWRMGPWAIWRPLVTWRRVLRTICALRCGCFSTAMLKPEESASHQITVSDKLLRRALAPHQVHGLQGHFACSKLA